MHSAEVLWECDGDFRQNQYSRGHLWRFDGGVEVTASASPDVVPRPYALDAAVDPEEAYIAALSSCHMMWFLDMARRDGYAVRQYRDHAKGALVNDEGRIWMPKITFHVSVEWDGEAPDAAQYRALHDRAHHACFLANSVRTEIVIQFSEDAP